MKIHVLANEDDPEKIHFSYASVDILKQVSTLSLWQSAPVNDKNQKAQTVCLQLRAHPVVEEQEGEGEF